MKHILLTLLLISSSFIMYGQDKFSDLKVTYNPDSEIIGLQDSTTRTAEMTVVDADGKFYSVKIYKADPILQDIIAATLRSETYTFILKYDPTDTKTRYLMSDYAAYFVSDKKLARR